MTYFEAAILGIIQGLTEFLPVSSSGHLVLAEHLLEVKQPGISFEIIVHIGTLLSVVIYFHKRLWELVRSLWTRTMTAERKLVGLLVLGTIPAVLAGLLLKDFFEKTFGNPVETSIELIITGFILFIPGRLSPGTRSVDWFRSLLMGIGQAIAILPGISRSGTTIVAGLAAGVKPEVAAEFSFLLSIPAIAGAAVLNLAEAPPVPSELLGPFTCAVLLSFIFGLAAVYTVMATVRRGKLAWFGFYCIAAGLFGLYHFL